MTIVEFLLARITEDEARADDFEHVTALRRNGDSGTGGSAAAPFAWMGVQEIGFLPDRVRRECEAKRRIVEEHPMVDAIGWPQSGTACGLCGADPDGAVFADHEDPCPTLRALATVYAGHPDYDPDWA